MKGNVLAGLMALIVLVSVVMFSGCVEEETPAEATPTETPTPKTTTPISTPTTASSPPITLTPTPETSFEPKFVPGDIITLSPAREDAAHIIILGYNESDKKYRYDFAHKEHGKWTYYEGSNIRWVEAELFDEDFVKVDHYPLLTPTVTPTATPTSEPSPEESEVQPEILSHSSYVNDLGYFIVVGEVKNTLQSNIKYVKIVATFYDAQKNVIGTDFTYTALDILEPNQKSPFELSSYPDKIVPASYKLTVSNKETDEEPFTGLKILSHSAKIDDLGYHKIVGEVKNEGTQKATFVKVVCTYYGTGGKIIGTSFTYTDPDEIDVGDSAPFELSSYPRELRPSSYGLQVQGSEG